MPVWIMRFDAVTVGLFVVVFVLAVTAAIAILVLRRQSLNALADAGGASTRSSPLHAQLNRWMAENRSGVTRDGATIWIRPPTVVLEEWIDTRVLTRMPFVAAGWLTGVALLATFTLIALVLLNDVGPAINDATNMQPLSNAVGHMGGKFFIFALGILATILLQAEAGLVRSHLHDAAHRYGESLHERGVLRDAHEAEQESIRHGIFIQTLRELGEAQAERDAQLISLAEQEKTDRASHHEALVTIVSDSLVRKMMAHHNALLSSLKSVQASVEKLSSIEVSIKGIGDEVTTSLRNTIGRDIGDAIKRMLEELSEDLHKKLGDSFGSAMREELGRVSEDLNGIRVAVESQASSEVEKLVLQLRDSLSGGFASESNNMKESLAAFSDVVPRIEQQLRTVVDTLAQDFAQQSDTSKQTNEALLSRVSELVGALARQEQLTVESVQKLQQASAISQVETSNAMHATAAKFISASKSEMDVLVATMRNANGQTATDYQLLAEELRAATSSFANARLDLVAGANAIRSSVDSVASANSSVSATASHLREAAGQLERAAKGAADSGVQSAAVVSAAQTLVREQKDFATRLEGVWPTLLEGYAQSLEDTSHKIVNSWQRHTEHIDGSVGKISRAFESSASGFSGGVEELSQEVRKLRDHLDQYSKLTRPKA